MSADPLPIRVICRNSNLALKQVEEVFLKLPDLPYEVIPVSSYGDNHKEVSLFDNNIPDFFTRELDQALLNGEADVAIHSAKDMPFPLTVGLELIALTESQDKSDALVSRNKQMLSVLKKQAVIGTSSAARKEGILNLQDDLKTINIRGTIEERIKLIDECQADGIIVATCALNRLGLEHLIAEILPFKTHSLQGNLAVVAKVNNEKLIRLFASTDIRRKYGKVYLAGFGPGDPDLLTVKALKKLDEADVIFYDDLISDQILKRFKAEKIYVGKRKDHHSKEQIEINELLYQSAVMGKTVVRLKGGDPMIFAHAGEELEYLERNFIETEVIPGISSGFAAAALSKIPLTHRHISSSVTLFSGHAAQLPQIPEGGTLIIYMAASTLFQVARDLINRGWNAETPVALIYSVSLTDQSETLTTLGELILSNIPYKSPLIVIVGDVVKLKPVISPRKKEPVFLVTGTDASKYSKYGPVIHQPLINILPLSDYSVFKTKIGGIPKKYGWIFFTSKFSVRYFFEILYSSKKDVRFLSGCKIASIGASTSAEMKNFGIIPDLQPREENSDGLLTEFNKKNPASTTVLIPRSDQALNIIPNGLRNAGHLVDTWIIYKNEITHDVAPVDLNKINYITLSSPSSVDSFLYHYKTIPVQVKFLVRGTTTKAELIKRNVTEAKIELFEDFTKQQIYEKISSFKDR